MIYLTYGSDTEKARSKFRDLIAALLKKKPDATHTKITDEDFAAERVDELVEASGLFEIRTIIEFDHVLRNKEAKEIIVGRLGEIQDSKNIFVFLEGDIDAPTLKKFQKNGEKLQEFSLKNKATSDEPAGRPDFNIFSMTDAFGRRDRKQLWALYTTAKMKDVSDEEIHSILFWQLKSMFQALNARIPAASGLKPFVFQKALGFSKNFTPAELQKISSDLVSIYHDARRGIVDFDVALEKFILEV